MIVWQEDIDKLILKLEASGVRVLTDLQIVTHPQTIFMDVKTPVEIVLTEECKKDTLYMRVKHYGRPRVK